MKKILAMILAACLMLSLAVPAFATETTGATTEATAGAATDETETVTEPSVEAEVEGEEAEGEAEEAEEEHDHDHSAETTGTTETEEVSPVWKTVRIIVTVLEVITSLVMVVVILFQSGKEAGLSGAISGNNDTYASKHGKLDKKLAKATKWVAIAWLVLTLVLSLLP